ncbi:cell wall-active antibiotics response protein [Thermococcus thermotolerans]|uniref:cell wall-active antibiotics response protein n=1 Tax=Thermococcus thermotolerans TaxID=2969672 RepID=UPI0021581817|nr:cell wall-active antibiotics response protein [Thermococcus thermotolerans]
MRRGAGLLGILAGTVLTLLVIGTVVTALAFRGYIHIGWGPFREDAGPVKEIGRFHADSIVVRNLIGSVELVPSEVEGVVVKSNLPVNVSLENDVLTVYCLVEEKRSGFGISTHNLCGDYRNGKVVIEVGTGLRDVWIRDTVGDVFIGTNVTKALIEDTVGDLKGAAPAEYRIDDVVGDVVIHAGGDVTINNVVGDVRIHVPPDYTVSVSLDDVLGRVEKAHSSGGRQITIEISDVVGDVSIGQ